MTEDGMVCESSLAGLAFPRGLWAIKTENTLPQLKWVRHWFHSDFYFWNYYYILLCTSHHGEGGFSHLTQWEQSQKAPDSSSRLCLCWKESGRVAGSTWERSCLSVRSQDLTTLLSPWLSLASATWCRVGISMWWEGVNVSQSWDLS